MNAKEKADIQELNERLTRRRELENLLDRLGRELSQPEMEDFIRDIREKYSEKYPGLTLPTHTRTYRDAVFRLLFSDKKSLLELYNALTDSSYDREDELIITTLNGDIYISMNNDVSFIISSELFLLEQQSSVNGNMALRFLLYVADMYRTIIDMKRLYSSSVQKLPAPHFIVFYNGSRNHKDNRWNQDEITLRLSDCFQTKTRQTESGQAEEPELELKVRVLNINQGYNKALLEKCGILNEYSLFVECVESHAKTEVDIDTAVKKAVLYCIEKGILSDFLKTNKEKVVSMLISNYTSYDYEMDMKEEISQLKAQVAEQAGQLVQKDEQLAQNADQLADMRNELEQLKAKLRQLQET